MTDITEEKMKTGLLGDEYRRMVTPNKRTNHFKVFNSI